MAGPPFIELTPKALFDASLGALQARNLAQARAGFEALRRDPTLRADALHMLGVLAGLEGDDRRAASLIEEAILIDRNRPEFHRNLALARSKAGEHEAARSARHDFGVALHVNRRYREAVPIFEEILREVPAHLGVLVDLAASLHELGEYPKALRCTATVLLALRHRDGRVAELLERIRAAMPETYAAVAQSISTPRIPVEQQPDLLPKSLNNFANAALRSGLVDLAEAAYALSYALAPDEALVRWNLSHVHLLRGDFEHGFAHYESRWQWTGFNFPDRQLAKPLWGGEPVSGKRILVYAEQGFGDTIQFARFVPQLAGRGARIWFEVQPELFWLMKSAFRSEHRIEVIPRMPDPRRVHGDAPYDFHCGVMSLAKHLRLKLADLPGATCYLAAESEAVSRWSEKLGPRVQPRVGLVWAGRPDHARDRERSLSLITFHRALALPGIEWIALQVGSSREQLPTCGAQIRDFGDALHDFSETAALIANLDLVIAADTAVAHLAGAMGKEVWILVPQIPDWRWLLDRTDSPWYPTARLYRQPRIEDWNSVIDKVTQDLGERFR